MTNEEIALTIKQTDSADPDLLLLLWNNIKGLVQQKASIRAWQVQRPDEINDLMQEAWIILPEAIKYFDPTAGASFWTILRKYFLPRAFEIALYGKCCSSQSRDPLYYSEPLDAPHNEENVVQPIDMIEDPEAEGMFIAIDDESFRQNLRALLYDSLTHIPKDQCTLLRAMYLDGTLSLSEARNQRVLGDLSMSRYSQIYRTGLKNLCKYLLGRGRLAADRAGILDSVESVSYYNGGLAHFRRSHTSSVERVAIKHDSARAKLIDVEDLVRQAST